MKDIRAFVGIIEMVYGVGEKRRFYDILRTDQ
jgi:hypothetical protein